MHNNSSVYLSKNPTIGINLFVIYDDFILQGGLQYVDIR